MAHAPKTVAVKTQPQQPLARRRYALEIRQHMAWRWQALILAVAMLVGFAISAAILVAAACPPTNWPTSSSRRPSSTARTFAPCSSRPRR
ncbi:hypothetical protein [Variovorax sp. E3]|uniref:hypothetical protein n=1 Tax=Variovorax sp. E3 TaxID=1914993 RepID=UPI0022B70AF9|nr:hypothetical protein [Variovorax sp. E3]